MKSSLMTFAAQEAEHAAEAAEVSPYLLGGLTLVGFLVLLLFGYGFRNIRTRHR